MRRILAFTLSILLLGAATGCAANPAPTASPTPSAASSTDANATPVGVASADANATPAKQWTREEAVNQYLKTENGITTIKADAIKADYTVFQVVSADNSFNLKEVGYDKIAKLLDKLATVQMTEGDINAITEKPDFTWNLQAFTEAGKLHGDSVTIKATEKTQIDIYILVGDLSIRKVYTISDADGTALQKLAQELARTANAEK